MRRFMVSVPAAIVMGAILGVVKTEYNLNDDQATVTAILATVAILYLTKDLDNEKEL